MRFLADEGCDFAVVRALRAAGHEVTTVRETSPGATDDVVIRLAESDARILLTEDKDFGRLVFAGTRGPVGVVLIRFPAGARSTLGPTVTQLVKQQGGKLPGAFAVLQPGRVRIVPRTAGGAS